MRKAKKRQEEISYKWRKEGVTEAGREKAAY